MNKEKTFVTLVTGIVAFMASQVTSVMLLAFTLIVIDYITGMIASIVFLGIPFNRQTALKGAWSKIGYALLLFMAMVADLTIIEYATRLGLDWGNALFTSAMTIYILGSEGYSIIQNLLTWGTKAPDWMLHIFSLMRDESGKILKKATG